MLHGHFFGFYMQFQSFLGRLGLSISWGYSSRLKMGRTKTKRYFELLLEFVHSAQIYTIHVCLSCILLWTWTMMICRDEPNQNYLRVEAEALALYVLKDPKCSSKDLNITYNIEFISRIYSCSRVDILNIYIHFRVAGFDCACAWGAKYGCCKKCFQWRKILWKMLKALSFCS